VVHVSGISLALSYCGMSLLVVRFATIAYLLWSSWLSGGLAFALEDDVSIGQRLQRMCDKHTMIAVGCVRGCRCYVWSRGYALFWLGWRVATNCVRRARADASCLLGRLWGILRVWVLNRPQASSGVDRYLLYCISTQSTACLPQSSYSITTRI
jgi:hypothetical protein